MAAGKREKSRNPKPRSGHGNKLATLPKNAQVSKRPLLRPPITSRYNNADSPKIVYISASTPFMSAVKRVEKLLRLADKRLVQSATSYAKGRKHHRGKRAHMTAGAEAVDEVANIARTVDRLKETTDAEEILVKGTGRAIPKVMDIGLWFQQREEYAITTRTGTVSGIDDVEYEQPAQVGDEEQDPEQMDVDPTSSHQDASRVVKREQVEISDDVVAVTETRIRKMSVLELRISLR